MNFVNPLHRIRLHRFSYQPINLEKKEKKKDTLIDPSAVRVLASVDNEELDQSSSFIQQSTSPAQYTLPPPSFCQELQEMDEN